jgi:hypothetical protein
MSEPSLKEDEVWEDCKYCVDGIDDMDRTCRACNGEGGGLVKNTMHKVKRESEDDEE